LQDLQDVNDVTDVLCYTYHNAARSGNETITIDVRDVPKANTGWRKAKFLRFTFLKMPLTLGIRGDNYQHYSVREIEIKAECVCNGHQQDCIKSNSSGQFECLCSHFTTGANCEMCLPGYNQQAFQYENPCEPCNCFGHSTVCEYNATVDFMNRSMNTLNQMDGGGVCVNCSSNTTGINCHKCVDFSYRPLDRSQTDPDPCVPCDCHGPGVRLNLETQLVGDCVMNNDTTLPFGMVPGDCFCKSNVTGNKCDVCKPGSFNLSLSNPVGCQDCLCDLRGTIDGSNICGSDTMGQCPCKTYTINRQCDECQDKYYGMEANNTEGCIPCDCDIGGSTSLVCDKISGQCPCRQNIGGRQCDTPLPGFYYPDPHFYHAEFEDLNKDWDRTIPGYNGFGYAVTSVNFTAGTRLVTSNIQKFGVEYNIILRYHTTEPNAELTVEIRGSPLLVEVTETVPICPTPWCHLVVGQDNNIFNLPSEIYTISVTSQQNVFLDRVIALPLSLKGTQNLLNMTLPVFDPPCRLVTNDMRLGTSDESLCLRSMFSVMSYYLDGSLSCACNLLGSYNNTCDTYMGQCHCKPGVMGRKCDQCMLEYYDLSSTGCKPCNCSGDDKICDFTSGQCKCPPNTEGRQCDQCIANHWSWNSTVGCQDCACNMTGSLNLQCNLTAGFCDCKSGVNGDKCDRCMDTYRDFSAIGCTGCNCDMEGSLSAVCDTEQGQCPCKNFTNGLLCDTCSMGSFYLNGGHWTGCLECICMGVTNVCTSTIYNYGQENLPLLDSSSPNISYLLSPFSMLNSEFQLMPEIDVSTVIVNGLSMAQVLNDGTMDLYFLHDQLQGNMLGTYESTISYKVHFEGITPDGDTLEGLKVFLIGHDDVTLVYQLPPVTQNMTTTIDLVMLETYWLKLSTNENVTRGEFLLTVHDVKNIYLPITIYSKSHYSRVGEIIVTSAGLEASGKVALGVEQCTCGDGYTGLSCERCASGFNRVNVTSHDYLGLCVRCNCHRHASLCDADTGHCLDCQHNTTGFNCEQCMLGWYGDATQGTPDDDCTVCPCHAPRVSNTSCIENGTVQCLHCNPGYTGDKCDSCDTFYWGDPHVLDTGTCTQCNCSGNTNDCNSTTGECLNCAHNTTGFYCEHCEDGTFGNAATQHCNACDCDMRGTNNSVCNRTSGQCECYPGVTNPTCNQCMVDYWGYSNTSFLGCIDCECNVFGSETTQCIQDTGVCICKPNVENVEKCDLCTTGFFGLPTQECQECSCNETGTLGHDPCEPITGQCKCKPGVDGRNCDQCQRLYFDFTDAGCRQCGRCQYGLGNDTQLLKDIWMEYWNVSQHLGQIQDNDRDLQNLTKVLNNTLGGFGVTEDALDVLSVSTESLKAIEPVLQQNLTDLLTKLNSTVDNTDQLQRDTEAELMRIQQLETNANLSVQIAKEENTTAHLLVEQLTMYNTTVQGLLDVTDIIYVHMDNTFSDEIGRIQAETPLMNTLAVDVAIMRNKTNDQATQFEEMRESCLAAEAEFQQLLLQGETLLGRTGDVESTVQRIDLLITEGMGHKNYTDSLVGEIESSQSMATTTLALSETSFNEGAQAFKDTDTILYGGILVGLLPLNSNVYAQGIYSWAEGSVELDNAIASNQEYNTSSVTQAEVYASELTGAANDLAFEFDKVKPRGERAVAAINTYETTTATLNQSLALATLANETVFSALESLKDVTSDSLNALAVTSKDDSAQISLLVENTNLDSQELGNQVDNARGEMDAAVQKWSDIDNDIAAFDQKALDLIAVVNGNQVMTKVGEGKADATLADNTAMTTLAQDAALTDAMNSQENTVAVIQGTVKNASVLMSDTVNQLDAFTSDLNNVVQRQIDITQGVQAEINQSRIDIESKMATLEDKLRRAKEIAALLEQPVRMVGDSATAVEVTSQDASPVKGLYNELSIDFRTTDPSQDQLLFFFEETTSEKMFSVEVLGGQVVFTFNLGSEKVSMVNLANLCQDCWFTILASRYGNTGHLTVTKTETGGTATVYNDGLSPEKQLNFDSLLHIGGLPTNYTTNKVSSGNFQGCLYNVRFDNQPIQIWQDQIEQGRAGCCARPPANTPVTLTTGVSFDGFGYMKINPFNFAVIYQSTFTLHFRTFNKYAVILLANKQGIAEYYGLYIRDGSLEFEYGTSANHNTITLTHPVNDGTWYKVTVFITSGAQSMTLMQVPPIGAMLQIEESSVTLPFIDLTALINAEVVIGGYNPDVNTGKDLLSMGFAGCIRNFEHSLGSEMVLTSHDLKDSGLEMKGVSTTGCLPEVVAGLGFSATDSYSELQMPQFSMITTSSISITFSTMQSNSMMLFAREKDNQDYLMSIGLYHGNLFFEYNRGGQSLQGPFMTSGMYLSNGLKHTAKVDVSSENPKVTIDNVTIVGDQVLNPPIFNFVDPYLFLGGTSHDIQLPQGLPLNQSMVGAITEVWINNKPLDLYHPNTYVSQSASYLSGLTPFPEALAPLPYTTTLPPPTTPPPTCASIGQGSFLEEGTRFGDHAQSYMMFNVSGLGAYFSQEFLISIEFRALNPNGIIFYTADKVQSPVFWMALYLSNKKLSFIIATDSDRTELKLENDYDDGNVHMVNVLRVNNFIAFLTVGEKDYINNDESSGPASFFSIGSEFYFGGVDTTKYGTTERLFTEVIITQTAIKPLSFPGCISAGLLSTSKLPDYLWDLSAPDSLDGVNTSNTPRQPSSWRGVGKCSRDINPGVGLIGDGSYLRLEYTKSININITLTFRSTMRNATLYTMHLSHTVFIQIRLVDGHVVVAVGNILSSDTPFIAESSLGSGFASCNYQPHTLSTVINSESGMRINVDGSGDEVFNYPSSNFMGPNDFFNDGTSVYVGGVGGSSPDFPASVEQMPSLIGCVEFVSINGITANIGDTTGSVGAQQGCSVL
ncbi:unnamed protein product, partial [Owenia fusiformis]